MATSPRFWDRVARRYSRMKIRDQAAFQARLEKTREYLGPESDLLDIGCGTGLVAVSHAPFVRHVRALDFSGNMIAIARERARAAGVDNIDFEIGAIDGFDAAPGSFDAVLAMSVLHLLDDRPAALARIFRWLKPGGVFVSSTICLRKSGLPGLILPLGRALGLLPAINFLTRDRLLDDIRAAGFGIEHEGQPGTGRAVFAVARKPGRTA